MSAHQRTRQAIKRCVPASVLALYRHVRWGVVDPRTVRRIDRHVLDRAGGAFVAAGPFRGMQLEVASTWNPPTLYLTGAYESELHGHVESLIARQPTVVVDVGSAEGYYAVGLARRLPRCEVHAFDVSPQAQAACRRVASLNAVSDRLTVAGLCTPRELQELCGRDSLLIVDCEGGEGDLLRPDLAPALSETTVLVELHEFVDAEIGLTVLSRFRSTHEVEVITAAAPSPDAWPVLVGLPLRQQLRVLDEGRPILPHPMRWAVLSPR